jgi:hypothetical protein
MILSQCHRPSFTPIQNNKQNCSCAHSNFYAFRQQKIKRKFLHWMVASITRMQSPLDFFFLICYVVHRYFNCASNMYLVFSAFSSKPASLLPSVKVCVFLHDIYVMCTSCEYSSEVLRASDLVN